MNERVIVSPRKELSIGGEKKCPVAGSISSELTDRVTLCVLFGRQVKTETLTLAAKCAFVGCGIDLTSDVQQRGGVEKCSGCGREQGKTSDGSSRPVLSMQIA